MTSDAQYWYSLFAPITKAAHSTLEQLRVGRTFLNGLRVDADMTPQPKADTVLDFESSLRVCGAESFFNFREYQAGGETGAGDRVGGDRRRTRAGGPLPQQPLDFVRRTFPEDNPRGERRKAGGAA